MISGATSSIFLFAVAVLLLSLPFAPITVTSFPLALADALAFAASAMYTKIVYLISCAVDIAVVIPTTELFLFISTGITKDVELPVFALG